MNDHRSSLLSVTKCAAFSAAFLLGALAPNYASENHSTPIGSGQGTGGPSPVIPNQAPMVTLQFSLVRLANGSPQGHATLVSAAGWIEFDLTSYLIDPVSGALSASGPITEVHGSPKFGPDSEAPINHVAQVGEVAFFQIFDSDGNHGKDSFIEGKVPFFIPTPPGGWTMPIIQQATGGVLPAFLCRQVVKGHFEIHHAKDENDDDRK